MLNCEYCNHFIERGKMGKAFEKFKFTNFSMADINEPIGMCEYTHFVFNQRVEDMEIEYPCNTIEVKSIPLPSKIDDKSWRYNYSKTHTKPEVKRVYKSA